MGVDYTAVAGYGIRITEDDIKEEFSEILEEEYDSEVYELFYSEGKIDLELVGSNYDGDLDYYFIISDPLNKDFEQELKPLNESGLLKKHIKPKDLRWICDLLIW